MIGGGWAPTPGRGVSLDPAEPGVPALARIGGIQIQVGVDTMEDLLGRLGEGALQSGAYPGGARRWRLTGQGWTAELGADAFDEGPAGFHLNEIRLRASSGEELPTASAIRSEPRLLNRVRLGMRLRDASALLREVGLRPAYGKGRLIVRQPGRFEVSPGTIYRWWRADLRFERNRLVEIRLTVSE